MKRLIAIVLVALTSQALAADRVETLDMRTLTGKLTAITDEQIKLEGEKGAQEVARADVAEVSMLPPGDAMGKAGTVVVTTAAGDVLPLTDLTMTDSKLTGTSAVLGQVTLDFSNVAMIYMPDKQLSPRDVEKIARDLKIGDMVKDVLIVQKGTEYVTVDGVLRSFTDKTISFNYEDQDREIARKSVVAIRAAIIDSRSAPARAGWIVGTDGTTLGFKTIAMKGDGFAVDAPGIPAATLPRTSVAAIRFASDKVTDLGTLKPSAVKQQGFFDKTFEYRVDRAVSGGPLKLGGKTYGTGLGLHSFCELTYKLDGHYKRFVCLAGIDDAARPAGDANLVILADGKPLGETIRLTGKADAQAVRLSVDGVKELTIRVDYGEDGLDVGDQVDLVMPRLMK